MKTLIQNICIVAIAFYLTTLIAPGLIISGNFLIFLIASFTFVIATSVLRPIISLFAFPFAYLSTLFVIIASNVLALYIVALLYNSVQISSFTINTFGVLDQSYSIQGFLSYIIISVIIAMIVKLLEWVFDLI